MTNEVKEVEKVEIIEAVEPAKEEIVLDGLDPKEQDKAKELGIVPKEEKKEEVKKVEETKEQVKTFEDIEKNEKEGLTGLSKTETGMYFKWKHEKKERQRAQRDEELATIREKSLAKELNKIKEDSTLSIEKLNKINAILNGDPDDITVEALQEILRQAPVKAKEDDKDRPLTVKDLEQLQEKNQKESKEQEEKRKAIEQRVFEAEEFGKTKFDNYDEIVTQAQEVLEGKVEIPSVIDRGQLSTKLVEALQNKDVEYETIAEYVLGIAKLNPNFGKAKKEEAKEVKKETNENIDRILKNASKQQTSASVGNSNGRRMVSVEDISLEDAAKLSNEAYAKLPESVRRRLKMEASQI